jgi:alkylated DNA repair dioxygenase AlkB
MFLPGIMNQENINLLPRDGLLTYQTGVFSRLHSDEIFNKLRSSIKWRQDEITIFGKTHPQPRLTCWYGERAYTYSGLTMTPDPWNPELLDIKDRVEKTSGKIFNSLLVNCYRDGNDHVSWHSDDERELGPNPVIASVSFGEVRRFQLKHRFDKNQKMITLDLEPGSLLIMGGAIQRNWVHRIAKTSKTKEGRINLTFRSIT